MRCKHLAIGALTLAFGISCDSKGEGQADADAKAQANAVAGADVSGKSGAKAELAVGAVGEADASADVAADVEIDAAVKPQIGGTIILIGDYDVELLAFVGGHIEAVIMDAKGAVLAGSDKLQLGVTLAAKGDARAEVDLKWDAELARFTGQVDAGIELVPGPVELELTVDGKASVGTMAELALAADAAHGGQVMVAGKYSLELVADAGFVHAYVFDASGRAHAAGDLDLDLDIDAASKLDLKWDPPSASYKAKLEGDLDLAAKPLVVRVAAEGKIAFAAVQSFHASAKLAMKADAKLDADVHAPSVAAKTDASAKVGAGAKAGGSVKAGAKVETKKSASTKTSVKIGDGVKAGGSAKAKASFKLGS